MFKLFILVCIFMLQRTVNAAVAIQPYVEKPPELACEEGCYVTSLEEVLPYNEPYSPQDGTSCLRYICRDDNTTLIESCGVIAVGKNCELIKGDLFEPYPECCDGAKCPTK